MEVAESIKLVVLHMWLCTNGLPFFILRYSLTLLTKVSDALAVGGHHCRHWFGTIAMSPFLIYRKNLLWQKHQNFNFQLICFHLLHYWVNENILTKNNLKRCLFCCSEDLHFAFLKYNIHIANMMNLGVLYMRILISIYSLELLWRKKIKSGL